MDKIIKCYVGEAWAMEKDGLVYYSNNAFFGIKKYTMLPPELGGRPHKFICQLMSSIDPPEENWEEIAHQLYAMREGWA